MRIRGSRLARIVLSLSILALTSVSLAQGQGVGASRGLPSTGGGIHTIQGRVYSAGRPIETGLKVRLESPNTGALSTVTDSDGVFIFTNLEAGNYRLTVDGGPGFENVADYPSIYREASPGGRIVRLALHLRPRARADSDLTNVRKEALDHYRKGLESARVGDSKKAVQQLEQAISFYPRFVDALKELGAQYLKLADPKKAAKVLDAAVKIAPDDFEVRLYLGIALLNLKKFVESEEQLRVALEKNQSAPTAHMYLGIALLSQNRLNEAQKELEESISSKSPDVGLAHRYLGGIYWAQRDYKRAADELEAYLKLMPKAADAEKTRVAIRDLRSRK